MCQHTLMLPCVMTFHRFMANQTLQHKSTDMLKEKEEDMNRHIANEPAAEPAAAEQQVDEQMDHASAISALHTKLEDQLAKELATLQAEVANLKVDLKEAEQQGLAQQTEVTNLNKQLKVVAQQALQIADHQQLQNKQFADQKNDHLELGALLERSCQHLQDQIQPQDHHRATGRRQR